MHRLVVRALLALSVTPALVALPTLGGPAPRPAARLETPVSISVGMVAATGGVGADAERPGREVRAQLVEVTESTRSRGTAGGRRSS